jgi:hypothetical protein
MKGGTSAACWKDEREVNDKYIFSQCAQCPQVLIIMWTKKEVHEHLYALKFTAELGVC